MKIIYCGNANPINQKSILRLPNVWDSFKNEIGSTHCSRILLIFFQFPGFNMIFNFSIFLFVTIRLGNADVWGFFFFFFPVMKSAILKWSRALKSIIKLRGKVASVDNNCLQIPGISLINFYNKLVEYEMIASKLYFLWRRKSAMLTDRILSGK